MPDIQERFKEAWSHALAGINSAEQEAENASDPGHGPDPDVVSTGGEGFVAGETEVVD